MKNISFFEKVYAVTGSIPRGKVMSYGQIALLLDMPRGAREVGWALSRVKDSDMVPWWRVVNNRGRVSIKGKFSAEEQRQLLIREGIKVLDDFTFDIEKYRHTPQEKVVQKCDIINIYCYETGTVYPLCILVLLFCSNIHF